MSAPCRTIGILCLQGDYEAHGRALADLDTPWRDVRRPEELEGLTGLVLPGGESTTMWHFLRQDGFVAALLAFGRRGGALFGTCAGAILLAQEVENPRGTGLGLLDITVVRNAYGRQTESSVRTALIHDAEGLGEGMRPGKEVEAVLIRAPRFARLGDGVRVRARLGDDPVWIEAGRVMATTFHPELGRERAPHRRFLALANGG